MKTPPCHNRAEFTDPNAGWRFTHRWACRTNRKGVKAIMPVMRYRHPWFVDRCTVHDKADIGPGQTYAQAHGWGCSGCRLLPAHVAAEASTELPTALAMGEERLELHLVDRLFSRTDTAAQRALTALCLADPARPGHAL